MANGTPIFLGLLDGQHPGGVGVAKPEWGVKRLCPSCGARFYDLRKNPIVCPSCGSSFDPEAFVKTRRSRSSPPEDKTPKPAPKPESKKDTDKAEADEVEGEEIEADEEEETFEDASELGEDEDDVAEVVEKTDETKEDR